MNTTTPAVELLPCPFCGESAETDFIPEHDSYQIECSDCIGCYGRVTRDTEIGAIEAWNRREYAQAALADKDADLNFLTQALKIAGRSAHGMTKRIAAMTAERDALRQDAERYRWLRSAVDATDGEFFVGVDSIDHCGRWALSGEESDETIDAAMTKEPK